MPFPVDPIYIQEAEKALGFLFPPIFKSKMMKENGGQVGDGEDYWFLFPFFDKTDRKRISRTANHIVHETASAREWEDFPTNAVAIGHNGGGDYLVLVADAGSQLSETVYAWWHETGELEKQGETIMDL